MRVACLLLFFAIRATGADDPEAIRLFETKIRPVLASRCFACHSTKAPKLQGGLLLDSQAGVGKGGNAGSDVVAGDPERSLLIRAIRYQDKDLKMPPGKPLPQEVVTDFETWIKAGAPMPPDAEIAKTAGKTFWSFQAPKTVPVPVVQHAGEARNAIDNFVLAKLEEKGIAPSPPADKRTLIRRVTYDLTGLPPSAAEVEAFIADQSPDGYAKLVDRLLASPHYGERWGRYWLDVARYSDARNIGDRFPFSYTYRDWVIRALNDDMPYDRFLRLQLAADQIPGERDPRNLAALGYLSLGREFPKTFPETVDDRIDAVARGMLGLTVGCARCHDHKYDPIPTRDYYSFYSIFANIREPKELPLLKPSSRKTHLDDVWQPRLDRIRKIDADYRQKRCAEMVAFFKTQIADYLIAVRDARQMSNTAVEELVRDRQLNIHLLGRWRRYLATTEARDVFGLWTDLAEIPDAGFAAKSPQVIEAGAGANPLVLEALRAHPPASIRDAAALYAATLMHYDGAAPLSGPGEPLRLALRGINAPVNVPLNEFELIYTEGDGNNTRGFLARYEATRAQYAYAGAAPRAMAMEDVPNPQIAHVMIRGNPNNPGVETPPHFLTCLTSGDPAVFPIDHARLELAQAIASRQNPVTARVIVNRVWMHHFGYGIVRTPSDFGVRGDPPTHPELLDYLAVQFMDSGWSLKKLHRMILLSATYRQSSADNLDARRVDPENQLLWRMNRQRLDIEALRDSLLMAAGQLDLTPGGTPYAFTAYPPVPRRTVYGFVERGRIPAFLINFDFASPDTHAPVRYTTTVPQQALFLLNSTFVAEQARRLAGRTRNESDPAKRVRELYRDAFGREATAEEIALAIRFVESAKDEIPKPAEPSPWQYGFGDRTFTPFRYFVDEGWQGASMLPDKDAGSARLRANGGQPGDDLPHAVVRRWVSPVSGKIEITGTLKHTQGPVQPVGDGVRGRIVSSRHGELAVWNVNGVSADTNFNGISVEKGDTIDFIVDAREDTENDAFTWAPVIHLLGGDTRWDAAKDFRGPAPEPLDEWGRYAQVLLDTNEFAFVD
jgi:hypothetical protein